eukprot:5112191-Alexandrium_andersonii.AAC.1
MEYWRNRLAYLERSYWEAANAWRDQRGTGHLVIPKANASPAKASPRKAPPPKLQASMPAAPVSTSEGIPAKPPPPGIPGTFTKAPPARPPAKASTPLGSMQQGPGMADIRLVESALQGLAKAPPSTPKAPGTKPPPP